MRNQDKSKDQLIRELCGLRKEIAEINGAQGKGTEGESHFGQYATRKRFLTGKVFVQEVHEGTEITFTVPINSNWEASQGINS